jgi:ribonuclease HI
MLLQCLLQASIRAIEVAKKASIEKLWIQTDSMFVINCINKWIEGQTPR